MRRNKSKEFLKIYETLDGLYPDAACSLDLDDPYFFLVRAILSAQCTDVRVNRTVIDLKKIAPTPEDVLKMGREKLEEAIKPCGLYRAKAGNIEATTKIFIEDWNKTIPKDIDELTKCPGIGRKIGNLLLGELYGIPALVVDTHCKRVAYRLRLTDQSDPLKVEKDVVSVAPSECLIRTGHLFVEFGRDICDARRPACDRCPLADMCREKRS